MRDVEGKEGRRDEGETLEWRGGVRTHVSTEKVSYLLKQE